MKGRVLIVEEVEKREDLSPVAKRLADDLSRRYETTALKPAFALKYCSESQRPPLMLITSPEHLEGLHAKLLIIRKPPDTSLENGGFPVVIEEQLEIWECHINFQLDAKPTTWEEFRELLDVITSLSPGR